MTLPKPTAHELSKWNKVDYFTRLLQSDINNKLRIDHYELSNWIHHNYESVIHTGNELNYKSYKKLTK
jgi:hypothetical protein